MGEKPDAARRVKRALRHLSGAEGDEGGAYRYVGLGLTFALAILLFFFLGYRLDRRLGTLPIFSVIGAFLGGIGGFLHLYRTLFHDDSDRKPPSE